jgi:HSP20 family protein
MNTQITRWNPFKEMDQMQKRMASLWNWEPFRIPTSGQEEALTVAEWVPNVDIVEDEKEFVIKAELPEMKREEVKVTVDDNVLTISGERRQEKEEKNKRYHRIECEYGSFTRSFTLPPGTLGDKVAAEFKDGVLRVHLPKDTKAAVGKSVEIKVS